MLVSTPHQSASPPPARLLAFASEYRIGTSRDTAPAGVLVAQLKNNGQDDHDLAVRNKRGQIIASTGVVAPRRPRPAAGSPAARPLRAGVHDRRPRGARDAHRARRACEEGGVMAGTTREAAMIERLWWRAGFGPRPRDLRGKRTHAELVHEFLHPRGATLEGPEPRVDGRPLDPDQPVRARRALVARPHGARPPPAGRAHDAQLARPLGDLERQGRRRPADDAPAAHAAPLRARQLPHPRRAPWCATARCRSGSTSPARATRRRTRTSRASSSSSSRSARTTATRSSDIREAARALTGFTFDYDSKRFGFDPKQHDGGTKHILGKHGRFTPARRRRPRAREQASRPLPVCADLGLLLAAAVPAAPAALARQGLYAARATRSRPCSR